MNALAEPELILEGGTPIHRQIRDQIRACILAGRLRPGEQLPTLRAVAVGLAINPNTVGRAYVQLEREGFLTTEDGSGTFVAPPPSLRFAVTRRQVWLDRLCRRWLARAERCGFSPAEVIDTLLAHVQRSSMSCGR